MTLEVEHHTQAPTEPISHTLRRRLAAMHLPCLGTDNISRVIENPEELALLVAEVGSKFEAVLDSLVIDWRNDHNARDTPRRVARMWVNELFAGRYTPMPEVTAFDNVTNLDQLYVVGPIDIRSVCAHHHMAIRGRCWIGVLPEPDAQVIGLSKFHRIVQHIAARPQIQEELAQGIADCLEHITKAAGIGVIIDANHLCCSHRGVKSDTGAMKTSVMRGVLRDQASVRNEFLNLIKL